MVIIHSRKEDDYKINVDYAPLLKEWCVPLKDYLHSDRQANLMSLIYKLYLPSNLNWKYIENKKDIFKPFQLTSPKETRVVMINFNPVFNKNSNGLAFANKTSFLLLIGSNIFNQTIKHELIVFFIMLFILSPIYFSY